MECYTSKSTSDASQCVAKSADYYECLHHKKEVCFELIDWWGLLNMQTNLEWIVISIVLQKARAILIANEMLKRKDGEGKLIDVVKKQFSVDTLGLVQE